MIVGSTFFMFSLVFSIPLALVTKSFCSFPPSAVGPNTTGQPEGGPDSRTVFVNNVSILRLFPYGHVAEDLHSLLVLFPFRYSLVHRKMLLLDTSISLGLS